MATSAGTIPISATFNSAQLEKDVLSALNRIQSKGTLNLNTRNFTQPLGKITGLANEFNKSLEASNARVVAFGASAGVIFAVQRSFSALVNSTIEVEKSLTDINIVLNTSSEGIKRFGDQLFEVAKNTGSSFKNVASAATEFSRQGLGLEETLRRTRDALILTRLSGLDVVTSTEAITAAVNSFRKEALTTTDVVNKLAAVDAKFAVSSRDLSEAIQRVGSSASEAGVSFDELLGIVTSVQQTTARGGAVIGNALKTIFTRVERPQVINDLKDFGITVTDISGNILPTIKVIENLAQSFQGLTPVVKSQVAELVGGVYQINILKAALSDVSKQNSVYTEATRTSSQAADEAILKNKALNESLSALLSETSANFTQFASKIGGDSVGPGIRKVLGYLNTGLESFNEKDSQGVGSKIATGLLKGITDFITGPGLGLGALAIGKLLSNFASFAGDATKNILGLNTLGKQQAVLQGEIGKILSNNPQLIQQIISGSKTRLEVEKQIRQTLYEQAAISKSIIDISESQARRIIVSGIGIDNKGQFQGKKYAEGYIPSQHQIAEKIGAVQAGYEPGKVVAAPKSIGGVMNTAEKVKYIPGFAQPYILPPEGSRAARNLTTKSMSQNGINPYKSKGFVPNFAPMPLENDAYGYGDDEWLRRASNAPVPLAQIRIDPKYEAAFDPSRPKGERFYRKDGQPFTGNDLNHFVRAGAKYGEIRAEMPESILMADPRYKQALRKGDASAIDLADVRKDFAPGRKIEGEKNIAEGIKQVYEPYSPPASMLVFDLDAENKERFADSDTGKIETNRKEGGRAFKIKSYALNASALNEERTGLIQKTKDFSRKTTKGLAGYIRPGEYSDSSVDEFFNKAGKNYNVLAGTIFEASTNLAANYTRDQAGGGGGDFDVIGGNIGNVKGFFPGFADQYGDYKLKNNDEAIQSFIGKVKSRFATEMSNHFKDQEIKAGSVTSGFKTSAEGFIPNFSYKTAKLGATSRQLKDDETGSYLTYYPGDFYNPKTKSQEKSLNVGYIKSKQRGQGQEMFDRFSKMARRLGVKGYSDLLIGQRDRLKKIIPEEEYDSLKEQLKAEEIKKYSILEDTSIEDVVKIAYPQLAYRQRGLSKNTGLSLSYPGRDGGTQLENLSGKDILSQVQNKLKTVYGGDNRSLIEDIIDQKIEITNLQDTFSKGHVPNFAYKVIKTKDDRTGREISDPKTGSFLEYSAKQDPKTKGPIQSLDIGYIQSRKKGQGQEMFDKLSKMARRLGVKVKSGSLVSQDARLEKIVPQKDYDFLTRQLSGEEMEGYSVLEKTSLEDIVKIAFPQLSYRQKGLTKNTDLKIDYRDYAGRIQYDELSGKNILSQTQNKLKDLYGNDKESLIQDILAKHVNIYNLQDTFPKRHVNNWRAKQNPNLANSGGGVPNFAEEEMSGFSKLLFLAKTSTLFSGKLLSGLINPTEILKLASGKGSIEAIFKPLIPVMKAPSQFIKSQGEMDAMKSLLSTLYSFDGLREQSAKFLSVVISESDFNGQKMAQKAEETAAEISYGKDENHAIVKELKGSYLKYRVFGGKKSVAEYDKGHKYATVPPLIENPDKTYRLNEASPVARSDMEDVIRTASTVFGPHSPKYGTEKLLEPKGKGGKFLGVTYKMGRFIGDLGRSRKAIRYQDTWDVDLHQNEKELLEGYLAGRSTKEQVDAVINRQQYNENYNGDLDTLMLRDLVAAITNPVTLKGIVRIPKDKRFSKGHVPNFNSVQEAMGREMSAGYSSSQVKVGQSNKLRTGFNPMGLGVYNSTEGSLNNGIGLAEKAGINPKTKGMSARGHIPNFAEFGGADIGITALAIVALVSPMQQLVRTVNELGEASKETIKTLTSAASASAQEIGQVKKDRGKLVAGIEKEIKGTFTNVNARTLKLTSGVAPLVRRTTIDAFGMRSSSITAASPDQVARLEELKTQRIEGLKRIKDRRNIAEAGNKQARADIARESAPIFGKGMLESGSKFSSYTKAIGTGVGLGIGAASNVGAQFIAPENKKTQAALSGIGDIGNYAGIGAAFGPYGAAAGALIGAGVLFKKIADAGAEEELDKINESLNKVKEKTSEFSGSAQNYATSLESLQSALNDPKTRPDALLKFQKNLTESLNSIPEEFRTKVLQAGADINKVSEAIAGVNKELGITQKNLEKQSAINQIIQKSSNFFGPATATPKSQKELNALFSSSINPEAISKNFNEQSFGSFIDSLTSQATQTITPLGYGPNPPKPSTIVNKGAVSDIKSKLIQKGVLPEEQASELDKAFATFDLSSILSIFDNLKKVGISVFDVSKKTAILSSILQENTERINANAKALKVLNDQFNDINLQISGQIDIEKNRAKTIREINKIQAEGAVSTQRARVKGALDAFSPFVGEGAKNDIQNQLDINDIIAKQGSQIREATGKLIDSFSESITKKAEEARSRIVPAIEGASGQDNIQKERAVFQRQIDKLTPLISKGLKEINSGGNVSDIRASLKSEITGSIGTGKAFTEEASNLLIQALDSSFSDLENKLADIKAQGDIDLDIQKASREYQKQSLALNQRLSFAGGAQALGSTGKSGVSDLFDSVSELVSEFRKTNTIGSAAEKGSTSFKFLDILTNQLQLNRSLNPSNDFVGPSASGDRFNAQVSSDLNPLAATAIAGRVQQIRESLDLAKNVTEIQTGKSTQGTALGTAFDMAKEGAVQTALDQIASQFKLENMGSYLDVLQQEARYLNDLTQKQNELLEQTLPTSINDNFRDVIETKVGKRLDNLTESLTAVVNKLSVSTQRNSLKTDISNLLPSTIDAAQREKLLKKLEGYKSGDLRENATPPPSPDPNDTGLTVPELQKYIKSFELVTALTKDAYVMDYGNNRIRGGVRTGPKLKDGSTSEVPVQDVQDAISTQVKFFKDGKQTLTEERAKSIINSIEQKALEPKYKTYKSESENISKELKIDFTSEQLKSLLQKITEQRNLDNAPELMDINGENKFGPFAGGYRFGPKTFPSGLDDQTEGGSTLISPPKQLLQGREDLDKRRAAADRNVGELLALNKEVERLLTQKNKTTEQEAKLLELQIKLREKGLQVENDNAKYNFDLYYKKGGLGDKSFKDERAAFANARIESNARQGNVDIEAITEKNTTYNKADFARDTGQLIDTFQTDFKSGIGSAFGEAIKGTKTLKDAFRDMFQGILNRMLDKSLEMGVDALFAFGKAYATGKKDGGPIKGYNSGGMVTGGSGMKDDVPAMMSGGEYVIKKSSVNKYGTDYLRNLNGGAVPRYATGGFSLGPLQNEFLYDNPDRPTSGEYAVDSRLSAAALTDDSNPQNKLRQDRYDKLDQYLQDRAQYEADKKQVLKNYKNQVNSTFYSGLAAAGIQLGAAGLTMGAQKLNAKPKLSNIPGAGLEPGGAGFSQDQLNAQYSKYGRATGGYIARFAGGGSTGKDNIPALLMGGEYIMNKKAVDMYGKDFMGQLNSGSLPKYARGGMVGTSYSGQSNTDQSSSMDELVTALNALNDNLAKDSGITQSESGRASVAGATQESGMSVVNNISINMSQGGEVTSEANSTNQKGASNSKNDQSSMQNNGKLAELLRSKVVEVLVEQKRPGGLLYSTR